MSQVIRSICIAPTDSQRKPLINGYIGHYSTPDVLFYFYRFSINFSGVDRDQDAYSNFANSQIRC